MEITAEEDHMFCIWGSKQMIDNYIRNNDYRAAFSLLIVILDRLDNDEKKVYAIDPAYDKNADDFIGIYYAEVTHESIKPFLESKGYTFEFIPLSRPAQSTTNDVFCQSWSLLILLDMLHNNKYKEHNV